MDLICVPSVLAGFFVFITYYLAHQRGYKRGYRKAIETRALIDLGASVEKVKQAEVNLMWRGNGKEGGFEGLDPLAPEAATIKQGWKLPESPICPNCNSAAIAVVHHTGDGFVMGWECSKEGDPDPFWWEDGCEGVGEPIEWPFEETYVYNDDWSLAGFSVV